MRTPIGYRYVDFSSDDINRELDLTTHEMHRRQRSRRLAVDVKSLEQLLGLLEATLTDPQLSQAHERARTDSNIPRLSDTQPRSTHGPSSTRSDTARANHPLMTAASPTTEAYMNASVRATRIAPTPSSSPRYAS